MTLKCLALTLALAVMGGAAAADMIVINGRYVVAKQDIRSYFYRDGRATVFDVRWSDWSTRYKCQDEYDKAKVLAASLNLTLQLKDATDLDFGDFLSGEGFSDCQKF